jgi:hypothetical protein
MSNVAETRGGRGRGRGRGRGPWGTRLVAQMRRKIEWCQYWWFVIYAYELKVLSVVRNELRQELKRSPKFVVRETTDKLIVRPSWGEKSGSFKGTIRTWGSWQRRPSRGCSCLKQRHSYTFIEPEVAYI